MIKVAVKVVIFCIAVVAINACKVAQTTKVDKEGFEPLFNGKNWDGWYLKIRNGDSVLATKVYAIENGMVHVFKDFADSSDLNTGKNPTHGLFYTKKKYSKYILKFEYKWGKKITNNFASFQYDAGVYYHVIDDAIWPKGVEYQVRYNHLKNKNHTGDYWGLPVNEWTANDKNEFTFLAEGGTLKPVKQGEHLATATTNFNALNDKWNECEIIVMGNEYSIHKLNGDIVNVGKKLAVSAGIIGFQSETAEIFYKNIKIKEFKEIVPIEEFLTKN
jgi:hypothetical protein